MIIFAAATVPRTQVSRHVYFLALPVEITRACWRHTALFGNVGFLILQVPVWVHRESIVLVLRQVPWPLTRDVGVRMKDFLQWYFRFQGFQPDPTLGESSNECLIPYWTITHIS